MPKQIIKDIQIKKKISAKPKVEPALIKNTQHTQTTKNILKEKDVLLETQYKDKEPIESFSKINKPRSKKAKIFIIIILIFFIGIFALLHLTTKTKITIVPKIINKDINESITLISWTDPLETTVMSFTEEANTDANNLENAQNELKEKIKNRFQYDTPQGYILIPGCETNIYYENGPNIENTNDFKMIGKISALLIKKDSVYDYINSSLNLESSIIKDISNVDCELKSDITIYEIGQKNSNISFILSGPIKYEKIIDQDKVKNEIKNKWKKEAIIYLNSNEDILSFSLKLRPINFFPLISKDSKKIQISIDSILN